ncbi:hypothetical protein [Sandarakinorhabdus sp.]|uniref:hypothetical protein n=1 Tax=Sandarakinorhabdus sp. TaxID=1916663 RepID=UPI003F6FD9AE
MTKEPDKQAQARAERLAAALRANLRKRKGVGGRADPLEDQHPSNNSADLSKDRHPARDSD